MDNVFLCSLIHTGYRKAQILPVLSTHRHELTCVGSRCIGRKFFIYAAHLIYILFVGSNRDILTPIDLIHPLQGQAVRTIVIRNELLIPASGDWHTPHIPILVTVIVKIKCNQHRIQCKLSTVVKDRIIRRGFHIYFKQLLSGYCDFTRRIQRRISSQCITVIRIPRPGCYQLHICHRCRPILRRCGGIRDIAIVHSGRILQYQLVIADYNHSRSQGNTSIKAIQQIS